MAGVKFVAMSDCKSGFLSTSQEIGWEEHS